MPTKSASTTRQLQLGRYLLAAPMLALLMLSYSGAAAQIVPTPVPAPARKPVPENIAYYVDAKPATQAEVNKIDPTTIEHMDVLKSAAQKKALGNPSADGVVLITTTANAKSPEVLAFNSRFPLTPATPEQNAASAAAQAYVTKNYPAAKIELAGPAPRQPGRYQVIFLEGGKRVQLLFDDNGQPVKQ